jgi:hypothetical protein
VIHPSMNEKRSKSPKMTAIAVFWAGQFESHVGKHDESMTYLGDPFEQMNRR